MRVKDGARFCSSLFLLSAVCLLLLSFAPAAAQNSSDVVIGRVVDSAEEPAVGFRVVFREVDDYQVALSQPTDLDGEYSLALPSGSVYLPIAVINPGGIRLALENQEPVSVGPGVRRDIVLAISLSAAAIEERTAFAGSDRLFLSFVEDTAMVGKSHWEGQLDYSSFEHSDHFLSRAIAAMQFDAMPRVEFGARFGIGGASFSGDMADQGGYTDLDLWGKLYVGPRWRPQTEFAVGALLTLGTGDEESGLGYGGLRSKIFGAARYSFDRWELTANAGLRFNEGVMIYGRPFDGEIAPSIGVGAVVPYNEKITIIGEFVWEGERFDGFEADSRLLAGVNWKPLPYGMLRLAIGAGLADGAPDSQILAGYSFDF
jgi:hypothetical protein